MSISFGGWPCTNCNNESPHWKVDYTDNPRKGDYEKTCYYCDHKVPVYTNPITVRKLRKTRFEIALEQDKMRKICTRCGRVQDMNVEPCCTWRIAECVQCGKRYDIF